MAMSKKTLLVFVLLTALLGGQAFAQQAPVGRAWTIPLTFTPNNPNANTFHLEFGTNPNATAGFDSGIDEIVPPPGFTYYVYFTAPPPTNFLRKDFRSTESATEQWIAVLSNTITNNITTTITWNPSQFPPGDIAGTLTINGQNMLTSNSLVINPFITAVVIQYTSPVVNAPTADFSGSPLSGPAPLSVTFTPAITGSAVIDTFSWSFPGGSPETVSGAGMPAPVNVVYNSAGTFDVSLSVTNNAGTDAETKTGYISAEAPANQAPIADPQDVSTDEDTPKAITLTATDPDDGPQPLTYTIVDAPQHGTLTGTPPNITYSPAANYHGPDTLTFKANDGADDSNIATVSITVNPVNDVPTANPQNLTTLEDTPLAITLTAADFDGDALTFAIVTPPAHGSLSGTPPNVTYTPSANYHGPDSFTFTADDGVIGTAEVSAPATVSITVTPVNDAPVADPQSVTTAEDTPAAITLTGSDVEGDALTFAIVTPPEHGTLSGTPPNVTYTPAANFFGPDSFTFKANDGSLDSAPATVSITVTPVNDAPVANPQNVIVQEDSSKLITLTGADVDGDPLTFTIVTGPVNGTLTGTPPNVTYTPSAGYNGPDAFTFKVNDGLLDSPPATVSINVIERNDPPLANPQSVTTNEDQPVAIILTGSDPEDQPLTFAIVTPPAHGTLSGTPPNVIYTPSTNFFGPDSFTFKVYDGVLDSEPATVSIVVMPVNDPPVALDQQVTTLEDTPLAMTLSATDADNDELTFSIITPPAHGTLSGTPPNVTYTPAINYFGPDAFTFAADDGHVNPVASDTATVSITVTPDSGKPIASPQHVTTPEDTPLPITLTGSDEEGDPLTFAIVTDPAHGTLSGTPPNVTYTPAANFFGPDSFTFKVNDGVLDSDPATVLITVTPVNDAPVANDQSVTTFLDLPVAITLTASDVENDPLTFTIVTGPANGTLSGTPPNVTYTPNTGFTGNDAFTFLANDGQLNSNTATVTITVDEEPVAPPIAGFFGTPLLGVTPLTVQFTDTSTGLITSWLWDFGDGNTSTEQHPQHTYDVQVDPKFTVSLTVTGPGGSDTETKVNYIEVLLALEVNIEAAPASGLAPLAVAFSSSSNVPIASYAWSFGDGGTSTEAHPTHTYLQPGSYTVTLVTETPLGRITTRRVNFVQVFDCFTKAPLSLVSGSPTYPGEGWDNAIDGDLDGWNGTVTADGNPPQAIFGFSDGNARMIDRVRLLTDTNVLFPSRWVKEFRVLVSTTGTADSDFSEVLAGVKTGGAWEDFTFPAAGAKFVKLVIDKPTTGFRQLGEFEVWEALDANPPDTTLSSIAVSSPHVADGQDAATITIVLKNSNGAAITGKPSFAFKLFVSGTQNSVSPVTETATPGTYQATLTSLTAEVKTVSVLLGCTRLSKTPAGELATTTFVPIPVQLASLVFVQGAETYPDEGWDNAIDGDIVDWDGTTTISGTPAFGVFSFAGGATEKVAAVRLLTDTGVGFGSRWVRKFRILVSTSGTAAGNFTEVLQGELNGGGWQEFSMTPVPAKYVKLQIDTPASGFRQLGEFEVYVTGSGLAKSAAVEQAGLAGLPTEFALSQNYPNPFNPETVIRIELPASVPTRLDLYDLQGRLVRRLVDKEMTAGVHNLKWDGTDEQGRRVSSGIYCYRLQAGSFVQIKRMTLLK